jgi:glycosyltransferase involved in cell wall biosynthesis
MGVVIVEALAAGTPVITYNFGPMPELVCHGKTGYVISIGNITELAVAIIDSYQTAVNNFQSTDLYRSAAAIYTTQEVSRCYLKLFKKIYDKKYSS